MSVLPKQLRIFLWSLPGWLLAWLFGIAGLFIMLSQVDHGRPGVLLIVGVIYLWGLLLGIFELPFLYLVAAGFQWLTQPMMRAWPWPRKAMLWLLWGLTLGWVILLPVGLLLGGPFGWAFAAAIGSLAVVPTVLIIAVLGLVDAGRVLLHRWLAIR